MASLEGLHDLSGRRRRLELLLQEVIDVLPRLDAAVRGVHLPVRHERRRNDRGESRNIALRVYDPFWTIFRLFLGCHFARTTPPDQWWDLLRTVRTPLQKVLLTVVSHAPGVHYSTLRASSTKDI